MKLMKVHYWLSIRQSWFYDNRYLLGMHLMLAMCDCMEYEYEEVATENEVEEPLRVAAPIPVARSKKR